jgi:hypothetical protein
MFAAAPGVDPGLVIFPGVTHHDFSHIAPINTIEYVHRSCSGSVITLRVLGMGFKINPT